MVDSPIAKSLAKVVIVAAKTENEIHAEQLECVKDLLFQLPEISERSWQELNCLLQSPIDAKKRRAYLQELKVLLSSEEERAFALYALNRVMNIDGTGSKNEPVPVQAMQEAIGKVTAKTVDKISRLLRVPIKIRSAINTREVQQICAIETMLEERVSDLKSAQLSMCMDDTEMRKLCLAGILMARVIGADGVLEDKEVAQTVRYLEEKWKLSTEEAHFVIIVSLSGKVEELDLIRVCRHFYEFTSELERIQFLDVLFQVGMEDGKLMDDEIDEVINIAANLKLEQDHFQTAFNRIVQTI